MKQNIQPLAACFLSLTCFGILCGCGSLPKQYAPSERPSFFESEIRSKAWTDPDGVKVAFLGSTITNFGAQGEMMIARFGDTNANQVRCLELYRINRKANPTLRDTFVLLDHDWGPREQGWWPSIVISVEPIVGADRITFRITRETLPGRGVERKRLLYFLDYRTGVGVRPNMSELWLAVPDGS
jgi:hypothetical protein